MVADWSAPAVARSTAPSSSMAQRYADHLVVAFCARRVARAHQELDAAKVDDPRSEQAHQILRHIYFPGWKHRPQLTHVRRLHGAHGEAVVSAGAQRSLELALRVFEVAGPIVQEVAGEPVGDIRAANARGHALEDAHSEDLVAAQCCRGEQLLLSASTCISTAFMQQVLLSDPVTFCFDCSGRPASIAITVKPAGDVIATARDASAKLHQLASIVLTECLL